MKGIARRSLLAAGPALLAAGPARAADDFGYRGWRYTAKAVKGELPPALIRSLEAQVDIVEGLAIRPQIKTFFRNIPGVIAPDAKGGGGNYSFDRDRMELTTTPQPPGNPVLLHELLHGYHDQRLTRFNPTLLRHFEAAKKAGAFRPDAYMFTNPAEFFAMCASVVLWGKAARPPSTRAQVKDKLPETYAWIVEEFGLTGA